MALLIDCRCRSNLSRSDSSGATGRSAMQASCWRKAGIGSASRTMCGTERVTWRVMSGGGGSSRLRRAGSGSTSTVRSPSLTKPRCISETTPPPKKKNKNKQTKNKQNNITKRASVVHSQWCGVLLLFLFMYSHFYSFADLSTANPLLKSIHSTNRHINNRYLTLIDWHFLMYSHSYSFADLSTANPLLKSICSKNRHLNNRYLPIMDTTTKHRVLCIILARTIFQKRHSTFLYSHSYSFADLSTANPLLKSMYSKNWHIHNRYLPITDTTAKHRVLCIILARTIVR